jgi:hypothetical protein
MVGEQSSAPRNVSLRITFHGALYSQELGLMWRAQPLLLPIFSQTQYVGDNVVEVATLNDDVGHALVRSAKRSSEGRAVHSGCVGNMLESRRDEIG